MSMTLGEIYNAVGECNLGAAESVELVRNNINTLVVVRVGETPAVQPVPPKQQVEAPAPVQQAVREEVE